MEEIEEIEEMVSARKRYNNHVEKLSLNRYVHLAVWAECNASGALVYAYLRDWIKYNEEHQKNIHDGQPWVYRTNEEIYEGLGKVLSLRTISTAIKSLVKHKYLKSCDFNRVRCNRTKYYALVRDPDKVYHGQESTKADDVLLLKEEMDAKNSLVSGARKEHPKAPYYINMLMNADYTDTAAEETIYDDYDRPFCFAELTESEKCEVVTAYVVDTLKKGDTPSFNNFVTEGVQEVYAKRHPWMCG